jgi:hypothetical protein
VTPSPPLFVLPLALFLSGLCTACQSAAPGTLKVSSHAVSRSAVSGSAVSGSAAGADEPGPVAVIQGRPLSKAALADFWFERYRDEYGRTLDALVEERLTISEAYRHGIRVPAAALGKAVESEVEARRKQIQSVYGKEADLEAEVKNAYGVGVQTWREKILGPRLHARLLMERVIRWDTNGRERVLGRVIVMEDAAGAMRVVAKVRRGADFSLTAVKESKDPSGKRGGVLPWMGRGDLAFPGVEKRLFAAQAGQVVGPLEVQVQGKPQWQIYKIIRRMPAWTGGYEANYQRLEADLKTTPVGNGEYTRWRARTRRDAGVRYYRPDGRIWMAPVRR